MNKQELSLKINDEFLDTTSKEILYTLMEEFDNLVTENSSEETLEEVAEKLTNDFPVLEVRFNLTNEEIYGWFLEALQKGAKWQQERMYNDEEVFNIIDKVFHMYASSYRKDAKEWFEKFKKK